MTRLCTIEGCSSPHYGRGYCTKHYERWRARSGVKTCSIDGCGRPLFSNGYCKRHHDRWRRHGDPNICLKQMSERGGAMEWLRSHVEFQGEECLPWPFARHPDGRATMTGGWACRIMCELAHGSSPSTLHEAAHSCGKGHEACINPRHLRWATKAENEADKLLHGTVAVGERLPQSKLTHENVLTILSLRGQMKQREIAAMFGVDITCINKIFTGRSWRHVQP